MNDPAPYVVVGLGNEFRSDDGCGPATARRVIEMCDGQVDLIQPLADATGLIMAWCEYRAVFLIDGVKSGAEPGKIFRFEPFIENLPEDVFPPASSHRLSLSQIIEIARTLGKQPRQLVLYGIEGINFDYGTVMTPQVATAVLEVADRIVAEIGRVADV